jgi:hypothetical protein
MFWRVEDCVFWEVAKLEAVALKPVDHFLRFAHMTWTEAGLMSDGNVLSRLVCGRSDDFMLEHQWLFENLSWAASLSNNEQIPMLKIPKLLGLTVELALCHAASFHRRIVMPYTRCLFRSTTNTITRFFFCRSLI